MSTKYSNSSDEIRIKTVIKFNKVLNNLKLSKIIEKSIYNYVIEVAKNKNIIRLWSDNVFKQLYISKCISKISSIFYYE